MDRRFIAGLIGAAVLVTLVLGASFWGFGQIRQTAAARLHTNQVLNRADDLLSALTDAENGERGYLLTGDAAFLEPFLSVRGRIGGDLAGLRALTLVDAARVHLDALAPLIDAKLAHMAKNVELRRQQQLERVVADVRSGAGKRLMDAVRAEMAAFVKIQEALLAERDAAFQRGMRQMSFLILAASLLAVLFALAFAYLAYRESRRHIEAQVLLETRHLLEIQEDTNQRLQHANLTLQVSEQKLAVTLHSIGDAVIATDARACVTFLNPAAEKLTGWMQAEAVDRPVGEIFQILHRDTREPATIPITATLALGTNQSMDNHIVLVARNGRERPIADSCAPILAADGHVAGAVMVFRDVSAEHAAREALRAAGALQNAIFNSANFSSIATDAKGVIQIFNVGAERMLGYQAADMLNRVTPADISDPQELIARAGALSLELGVAIQPGFDALVFKASRGIEDIYELTYVRKDGSRFPALVSVTALRDADGAIIGYLLIGTDNTARKQVEDKLRWTEQSFRLMVESVSDYAIVMLDPKGCVVSWNSGAQRIKGYNAEEIIGQHVSRFYLHEDIENCIPQRDLEVAKVAGRLEAEGWRIRKDGSTFWANVVFTAIRDADGELRGFAKLTQDLTRRRSIEAALTDAKSVAEKASLAKSTFLSSMSHELRSPLNAILGFGQLMESDLPPPTPGQQESITQILKAGWHLLTLINEILDLAKVESGRIPMSQEPVALSEVLEECRGMIEPLTQERGIRMHFPVLDTEHFVVADRTRVKQVIINLLSNAIKYNRPQGVVEVSCAASSPGRIRVGIRDTGAGLDALQTAQLFQPFNRLGQEAGGEEGTGIGLVVAKRLVELMGGTIGVESAVAVGSLFWFDLVATAAPRLANDHPAVAAVALPQALSSTRPDTVLYVEDNPANLKLVEKIFLRHPAMRLLTAINGTLGVALAREALPDVILMDINLPGISGMDALKILREDPLTAHIPVIAITANAMPRDIELGLAAGFFRYITKPIKVDEFMASLQVALTFASQRPAALGKE